MCVRKRSARCSWLVALRMLLRYLSISILISAPDTRMYLVRVAIGCRRVRHHPGFHALRVAARDKLVDKFGDPTQQVFIVLVDT